MAKKVTMSFDDKEFEAWEESCLQKGIVSQSGNTNMTEFFRQSANSFSDDPVIKEIGLLKRALIKISKKLDSLA